MFEKDLRAAVFTRQNMLAIPLEEVFDGDVINCTRLAHIVTVAKRAGIAWFQGGAFATRAQGLADDDDFYNHLDHKNITNPDDIAKQYQDGAFDAFDNGTDARIPLTGDVFPSDDGARALHRLAHQLHAFICENALCDCWLQCVLDEPNDALANTYCALCDIVRAEMPKIPILEPVLPTHAIVGALDVWCPSVNVYESDQFFYDARVAAGDRLFVYTCLTPGGNYCNRLLDMERLRIVYLAWGAAKYPNVEGFLHWGANQFSGDNPFKRQAAMFSEQILEFHPKRAMFIPAGDSCIFYPGYHEPLISVRSEAHRIGFEDLCLLQQLGAQDFAAAQRIVASLFRGYSDYEKSVTRYREVRRELLHLCCA